jgi:hypothetical protein
VPALLRLTRQASLQRTHWRLRLAIAFGIGPIEHGADPLPYPSRGFWFGEPDGRQNIADGRSFNIRYQTIPQCRKGIGRERIDPLRLVLAIFPGSPVLFMDKRGCNPKSRDSTCPLFSLHEDINTILHIQTPRPRGFTCFSKSKTCQSANTDVAAFAAGLDPKQPASPAWAGQAQNQPLAVRVSSRLLQAANLYRRQLSHGHTSKTPHRFPHLPDILSHTFPTLGVRSYGTYTEHMKTTQRQKPSVSAGFGNIWNDLGRVAWRRRRDSNPRYRCIRTTV